MMSEELGAVDYLRVTPEGVAQVRGGVIGETKWTLFVNRRELVSFMCTPSKLHLLALGFMRSENIIDSLDDVLQIRVYESATRSYWYQPALGLNGPLTMRTCEESVGVIDARVRGDPAPRLGVAPPGGNPVRGDPEHRLLGLSAFRTLLGRAPLSAPHRS